MALTLLVGGARSGKSSLAVELARRHGSTGADDRTSPDVVYVATALPDDDDDMRDRISRHRGERPGDWHTIEEPHDLGAALASIPAGTSAIIDCLTVWTSNLMAVGDSDATVELAARSVAAQAAARPGNTIAITNEVGSGVHPATALGRRYRDLHGRVNQIWAAVAQTALLVVAGRALRLDDPHTLLS